MSHLSQNYFQAATVGHLKVVFFSQVLLKKTNVNILSDIFSVRNFHWIKSTSRTFKIPDTTAVSFIFSRFQSHRYLTFPDILLLSVFHLLTQNYLSFLEIVERKFSNFITAIFATGSLPSRSKDIVCYWSLQAPLIYATSCSAIRKS